jgi:glycosyltransferase involved in cell wall biosynthesis
MKILATTTRVESLIAEIRMILPLTALATRHGWTLRAEPFHLCSRRDLAWADVLVMQRGTSRRHLRLAQRMLQLGGAVVYEIDDLLTDPADHLLHFAQLRRAARWVERCIAAADVVTASTHRLARALSPHARETLIVPNYAFPGLEASPAPADPAAPCTVLLASSDRVAALPLIDALRELQGEYGQRLQLVAVGIAAASLADSGLVCETHPLMPRADFLAFARALPNVVAAIPLDDSRFSACKSAIKWFDYAVAGVPTLCSRVAPYTDVIEDGLTGALVPNSRDDWAAALRRAIDDSAWRTRIACAAAATVRERFAFEQTVNAWGQALETAQRLRLRRDDVRLTLGWKVVERLLAPFDALFIAVRRANRRRLDRRQRR